MKRHYIFLNIFSLVSIAHWSIVPLSSWRLKWELVHSGKRVTTHKMKRWFQWWSWWYLLLVALVATHTNIVDLDLPLKSTVTCYLPIRPLEERIMMVEKQETHDRKMNRVTFQAQKDQINSDVASSWQPDVGCTVKQMHYNLWTCKPNSAFPFMNMALYC